MSAVSTNLSFTESGHEYRAGERRLSSVTTILREHNLYPSYAGVDPRYRMLGSAVHSAAHLHDLGLLDEASLHPEVAARLARYLDFKRDTGFIPRVWELPLADPGRDVAGMFDMLGECGGEIWLLDLKTGTVPVVGVGTQLAGYFDLITNGGRVMLKANKEDPRMPSVDIDWFEQVRHSPKLIRRKSLGLTPEKYTLRSHDEPKWMRYWNAAVTLHNAWKEHGL